MQKCQPQWTRGRKKMKMVQASPPDYWKHDKIRLSFCVWWWWWWWWWDRPERGFDRNSALQAACDTSIARVTGGVDCTLVKDTGRWLPCQCQGQQDEEKTLNLVLRTETVYKITKLLCNKKGEEEKKKTLLIVEKKEEKTMKRKSNWKQRKEKKRHQKNGETQQQPAGYYCCCCVVATKQIKPSSQGRGRGQLPYWASNEPRCLLTV